MVFGLILLLLACSDFFGTKPISWDDIIGKIHQDLMKVRLQEPLEDLSENCCFFLRTYRKYLEIALYDGSLSTDSMKCILKQLHSVNRRMLLFVEVMKTLRIRFLIASLSSLSMRMFWSADMIETGLDAFLCFLGSFWFSSITFIFLNRLEADWTHDRVFVDHMFRSVFGGDGGQDFHFLAYLDGLESSTGTCYRTEKLAMIESEIAKRSEKDILKLQGVGDMMGIFDLVLFLPGLISFNFVPITQNLKLLFPAS